MKPPRSHWRLSCPTVRSIAAIAAASFSFIIPSSLSGVEAEPKTQREWTAEDLVQVRSFFPGKVTTSPDGSMFCFFTRRADLASDSIFFELSVFATADVKAALEKSTKARAPIPPLQHIVRRSWDHGGGEFLDLRWEPAGGAVIFKAQDDGGARQVFRFEVASGQLTQLTRWPGKGARSLTLMMYGDTIIDTVSIDDVPTGKRAYPFYRPTSEDVSDLIGALDVDGRRRLTSFVTRKNRTVWEIKHGFFLGDGYPSSPTGERLIAITRNVNAQMPQTWGGYDRVADKRRRWDAPSADELSRFVVIDAEAGRDWPVFDAPWGCATEVGFQARNVPPCALWARDGRNVILVNTALPLGAGQNPERTHMAYIVALDVETGSWKEIEPLQVTDGSNGTIKSVAQVGWLKEGEELLIRHQIGDKPASGSLYRLKGASWEVTLVDASVGLPSMAPPGPPPTPSHGIKVTLRQGANEAPVFVATDGQRELPLTGPDPVLKELVWTRQQAFEWREPGGQTRKGGLYLPERKGGQPLPLVIQAYKYDPDRFQADGPTPFAFAAQWFASHGIAVLEVTIPAHDPAKLGKVQEFTDFVAEIDSAADTLAGQGLIDRQRVGLIGFSRGGYEAIYATTHPGKIPLAAVVVDDGFPGTYGAITLMSTVIPGDGAQFGAAFWQDKGLWLEHETSFNADRIRTPALITAHGQFNFMFHLPTISAFMLNRKPMEFLMFPDAGHGLEMPRERFASYQASIDWMAFWLKGEIPADPERAARWAILRKQQDEVLKTPPPPRMKLVPVGDDKSTAGR